MSTPRSRERMKIAVGTVWLCAVVALASGLLVSPVFAAKSASLSWEANTEPDLKGYKVYRGLLNCAAQGPLEPLTDAGLVTTYTDATIPDAATEVCYRLTAYDKAGNESAPSAQATKTFAAVPPPPAMGTPVITVGTISATTVTVTVPVGGDGTGGTAKVDLRYAIAPIGWGSAPSAVCPAFPCTIPGLTPGTKYDFQAVYYRGSFDLDAVFGPVSAPVQATTLVMDTTPPAPPKGLEITSATPDTVVITAAIGDCARVVTSTKGSTSTRWKRTVTCQRP